jgi:hypothetical protein
MRLPTSVCLVLAFAGLASGAHRDWSAAPPIVEIDTPEEIYAIGDVHADYDRLVKLLVGSRIIDAAPGGSSKCHWMAGKSVLIFTGDMIDKGPHALMVLGLIRAIGEVAQNNGGRVVALMGNHEAEFLAEPTAKKSKDFRAELAGTGRSPSDVAGCRGDLGQWLCSLPFAARVNDWFFSHAGNTDGRSISKLAGDLRSGVDRDGFASRELIGTNSLLEARLGTNGPGGRPWIEDGPGHDARQLLTAEAAALGVRHIVEGHQPSKVSFPDGVTRNAGELFQRYGLLFLIDTGMSVGVGDSHGAVLHIKGNGAVAICPSGKETVIWDGATHGDVGRAEPCGGRI